MLENINGRMVETNSQGNGIAINLGRNITATGQGVAQGISASARVFQATVQGTGAVSATVQILGSVDGIGWVLIGTINLSGTTLATDGFATSLTWPNVNYNVTAISGTGATVTVSVGI